MKTKTPPRSSGRGFTLIEVLIAMVLLAVGLLGLQSLGVSAVRSTALAERNSRSATTASQYLEEAIGEFRQGRVPAQLCRPLANGDSVSRSINISNAQRPEITVEITPVGSPAISYSITAHAFSPTPVTTEPAGDACP